MYQLLNGDSCEAIKDIKTESIHLQVFSPPFAELYVYSDHIADMGNCRDYNEFFEHFSFLIPDLNRILIPGRICAIHCMDLPIQKGKEGYIGLRDFSGMLIKAFQNNGFIYHSRITIWKDPVVEMQRTKALGLLHKQLKKDSSMSRVGLPDYVLVFRKEGDNPIPIKNEGIPVSLWQKYASPVWYDIDYGNTLNNYREGRDQNDEKHIAPLQLPTIERCVHLWSNVGETVFTPFAGIGSELYQSLKMGRNAIGIELKKSYYEIALKNCQNAVEASNQMNLLFN
jgi:DNA modification methylase